MRVCAGEIGFPVVHQSPPPLEQVRAGIGRLDLVMHDMGQRRLDDLARVVGLLGRPVPEAGPEAMGHGGDPVLLEDGVERRVGQRLAARAGEHERAVAAAERPRRAEDLQRPPAERDPVLALRLHARGRDGPHAVGRVHLGPQRPAHLTRAPGREHQELERQLEGGQRPRAVHRRRDLGVGQRPEVADGQIVRAEHRPEPVTRVIGAMFQRHGALQHGADALAQPPRGLRLAVPDGFEDFQHIVGRHLGDRPLADAGENIVLEAAPPVAGVARVAPALAQLVPDPLGGRGEQRYALGAAAVGERVSAVAGELAVDEGLVAGLGERDEPDAAESDVAPPAADRDALDPAAGAGGLDDEVESVTVAVPSDRRVADERGRESLVRVLPAGLGVPLSGGALRAIVHTLIISRLGRDFAGRSRTGRRVPTSGSSHLFSHLRQSADHTERHRTSCSYRPR